MVTAASLGPIAMSGSETGLATSEAPCAIAPVMKRSGEKPARAASPVSDRAALKARRVMINGLLPEWRVHARNELKKKRFASLKPQLWQWRATIAGRQRRLNFA